MPSLQWIKQNQREQTGKLIKNMINGDSKYITSDFQKCHLADFEKYYNQNYIKSCI